MKKTMTILGDTGDFFPEVIDVLIKQDLRLLFVSDDEASNSHLKSRLEQTKTEAEVEFIICEHDGCWEADIIVITQPELISTALLERIKEVATQKIVLAISKNKKELTSRLQQVLPHSKVVLLLLNSQEKEFAIFGIYPEARDEVQELFTGVGYEGNSRLF